MWAGTATCAPSTSTAISTPSTRGCATRRGCPPPLSPRLATSSAVYSRSSSAGRDVLSIHIAERPVGHLRERSRGGPAARRGGPSGAGRGPRQPDRRRRPRLPGARSPRASPSRARAVEDVVEAVRHARESLDIWFCLDTLEYLRRGGRIGAAQAMVGTALKIKPILTFGTEIAPVGRVRTHRRAFERMVDYLRELHERGASDWIVQHAQAPADAERLVAEGIAIFGSSRCSAPRSAPCSAPTSGAGCWSAG